MQPLTIAWNYIPNKAAILTQEHKIISWLVRKDNSNILNSASFDIKRKINTLGIETCMYIFQLAGLFKP